MGKGLMIVGVILVAVGLLWIGQGVGYIGGSFMTGQQQWTYIGVATAVVGAVLLLWTNLRTL